MRGSRRNNSIPILSFFCFLAVFWSCASSGVSSGATAQHLFYKAEGCYKALRNSPEKQKYRSYWLACIDKFSDVYRRYPSGSWAAAGLYQAGCLYEELYAHSFKADDIKAARDMFKKVIREYPKSLYSQKAKKHLKKKVSPPHESIAAIVKKDIPVKTAKAKPRVIANAKDSGKAVVTGIRYWSNPEYTRVVIDADRETSFKNNLLNKDPSIHKPNQRLYVDLMNSRLGDIKKTIPINDSLLESARAGQHAPDTVRVVVDIKSFDSYNIFSLKNPFRIVVDVRGVSAARPEVSYKKAPGNVSIARQLALGVRRIAIDPGHGGKDYGAPGYIKGVHEKNVVLKIAKRLAVKIKKELKCEVILTRQGDKYLTLEERTAIANTRKADLFISIHANASRDHRAAGIETYFLNLTTDNESISVAARENATSEKNISELQTILNDLLQNAKINESSRLATYVQKSLCRYVSRKYSRIHNKGVKRAPFYVLIGAQMPAILIETSFISNKTDCRRLTDPKYQDALCEGIIDGIRKYIKATQTTAYFDTPVHRDS